MENKSTQGNLKEKLTEHEPFITKAIKSGNSVEIHPAPDGTIKVYEVRKKVAK